MNFDDLKDQLLDLWNNLRAEIEDNPTYNSLREKYETLPPHMQKGIVGGGVVLLLFILMSIPYSYFESAKNYEQEYQEVRSVIRDLLKVGKPNLAQAGLEGQMTLDIIKERVSATLSSFRLLPEQIQDVATAAASQGSLARPPIKEETLVVRLKNLNLTQVVDIGFNLQQLFSAVKMTGLEILASQEKPDYFNVTYTLSKFSLTDLEDEPPGKKNREQGKRK